MWAECSGSVGEVTRADADYGGFNYPVTRRSLDLAVVPEPNVPDGVQGSGVDLKSGCDQVIQKLCAHLDSISGVYRCTVDACLRDHDDGLAIGRDHVSARRQD